MENSAYEVIGVEDVIGAIGLSLLGLGLGLLGLVNVMKKVVENCVTQ